MTAGAPDDRLGRSIIPNRRAPSCCSDGRAICLGSERRIRRVAGDRTRHEAPGNIALREAEWGAGHVSPVDKEKGLTNAGRDGQRATGAPAFYVIAGQKARRSPSSGDASKTIKKKSYYNARMSMESREGEEQNVYGNENSRPGDSVLSCLTVFFALDSNSRLVSFSGGATQWDREETAKKYEVG
ncbi:hypothetical protein MRX96_057612 [Rhipicephalus microplus]